MALWESYSRCGWLQSECAYKHAYGSVLFKSKQSDINVQSDAGNILHRGEGNLNITAGTSILLKGAEFHVIADPWAFPSGDGSDGRISIDSSEK